MSFIQLLIKELYDFLRSSFSQASDRFHPSDGRRALWEAILGSRSLQEIVEESQSDPSHFVNFFLGKIQTDPDRISAILLSEEGKGFAEILGDEAWVDFIERTEEELLWTPKAQKDLREAGLCPDDVSIEGRTVDRDLLLSFLKDFDHIDVVPGVLVSEATWEQQISFAKESGYVKKSSLEPIFSRGGLLNLHPERRMNVQDALVHPWIQKFAGPGGWTCPRLPELGVGEEIPHLDIHGPFELLWREIHTRHFLGSLCSANHFAAGLSQRVDEEMSYLFEDYHRSFRGDVPSYEIIEGLKITVLEYYMALNHPDVSVADLRDYRPDLVAYFNQYVWCAKKGAVGSSTPFRGGSVVREIRSGLDTFEESLRGYQESLDNFDFRGHIEEWLACRAEVQGVSTQAGDECALEIPQCLCLATSLQLHPGAIDQTEIEDDHDKDDGYDWNPPADHDPPVRLVHQADGRRSHEIQKKFDRFIVDVYQPQHEAVVQAMQKRARRRLNTDSNGRPGPGRAEDMESRGCDPGHIWDQESFRTRSGKEIGLHLTPMWSHSRKPLMTCGSIDFDNSGSAFGFPRLDDGSPGCVWDVTRIRADRV